MKAIRIEQHGGPEALQLVDIPVPEPGPGKVRVRISACGLNYSDVMIRGGTYLDAVKLPYLMGREFCGVVDQVGPGVTAWHPGQRVVGTVPGGALAEYAVIAAVALVPCPEELSPAEGAAFLIQGLTAWHCLHDCARLQPGESALIHAAAGGVGTLAVQMALAHGARVIGAASSEKKCQAIRDLGATAVNYSQGDWVAEVKRLTDGRGPDVILEAAGGETFRRSFLESLASFGRMVVFGVASGEIVPLTNVEILGSNKSLTGYYLGSYFPAHLDKVAAATMQIVNLIRRKKLRPVIGQRFPLADTAAAFACLEGRQSIGKVIVEP